VPVDPALLGWTLSSDEAYEVSREKLRDFATAVGEQAPLAHDTAAAHAAGFADVVAVPTFAIIAVFRGLDAFVEAAGVDYSRVVHADQQFSYVRPIVAGDRLGTTFTVDRLRALGTSDIVTLRTDIADHAGDPVCAAVSTIVISAPSDAEQEG